MEVAPTFTASEENRKKVAKASTGHDPLPFWISNDVKNWTQK
jgi:hypothetical protein